MIKYCRIFIFFSVLCIISSGWNHQDYNTIEDVIDKLAHHTTKFPQEKVYLHIDKEYTTLGEDIWFKAYLVDANDHSSSKLSTLVFVELILSKD